MRQYAYVRNWTQLGSLVTEKGCWQEGVVVQELHPSLTISYTAPSSAMQEAFEHTFIMGTVQGQNDTKSGRQRMQ